MMAFKCLLDYYKAVTIIIGLENAPRTHLKCSQLIPEHALVELAPFLASRQPYLSMPPLDNMPFAHTELQ